MDKHGGTKRTKYNKMRRAEQNIGEKWNIVSMGSRLGRVLENRNAMEMKMKLWNAQNIQIQCENRFPQRCYALLCVALL